MYFTGACPVEFNGHHGLLAAQARAARVGDQNIGAIPCASISCISVLMISRAPAAMPQVPMWTVTLARYSLSLPEYVLSSGFFP